MNQLNTVIVEGNVVRQAERSEPAQGFKVCKFPIAVNRYYKDANGEGKEEVSFIDVEVYGDYGEIVAKNCIKGRGVRVVGRIKQNRWEADGKSNSRVFIVAEHVEYRPLSGEMKKKFKGGNNDSMQQANDAAMAEEAYEEAAGF